MANETVETQNENSSKHEVGPMPKHMPFPDFISTYSELINELIIFAFFVTTSIMQFINIYHTDAWWLPDSYTNHLMNLYLIEPYLVFIIFVIAIRRLVYCLLLSGLEYLQKKKGFSNKEQEILRAFLRYTFAFMLAVVLICCVWKIYITHSDFALFLLLYPIIVYFLVYGFQIEPFLRTQCEVGGAYLNGLPMHSCSSNPSTIRAEIKALRADYNFRICQIIFTSALNTYFGAAMPCFFALSSNYNKIWATQHIIFVWLTGMTLSCAFIFPSKYGDLLHRASLHLGYWYHLENDSVLNSTTIAVNTYNEDQFYTNCTIVKHNDEYYKSFGPLTVAVPGNISDSRFYRVFKNPSLVFKVLSTLQACIVLWEIILLYFALEWHFMLSISFIALTSQYTLFKILRDYFISKRIYAAENLIGARHLHID